ncbi:hypothetical protein BC831DRAFT_443323 [Entophlyctis helioformis]|nr:hypothetical protein BC831DRAFT_443323 [Entophlyctis helioformis]
MRRARDVMATVHAHNATGRHYKTRALATHQQGTDQTATMTAATPTTAPAVHDLPADAGGFRDLFAPLPYNQRQQLASKLAYAHRDNPALTVLLRAVLSTPSFDGLPATVPFLVAAPVAETDAAPPAAADATGPPALVVEQVKLAYPQSNAVDWLLERNLAISMAVVAGKSQVETLMAIVTSPSASGKAEAIRVCAELASDEQLRHLHGACVPAIQTLLDTALIKSGRKIWPLPNAPGLGKPVDAPVAVLLRTELEWVQPAERADIWDKYSRMLPALKTSNMNDAKYVEPGKTLLMDLLDLAEQYPPMRIKPTKEHTAFPLIPPYLARRLQELVRVDAERVVRLVISTCYFSESPTHHSLSIPTAFFNKRKSNRFFVRSASNSSLLRPLIDHVFDVADGVLLPQTHNPIVTCGILDNCTLPNLSLVIDRTLAAMNGTNTDNCLAILNVCLRELFRRAHGTSITNKADCQAIFQDTATSVLVRLVPAVFRHFKARAKTDIEFLRLVHTQVIAPLTTSNKYAALYPPLVHELFVLVKGIFGMSHDQNDAELSNIALAFCKALAQMTTGVFGIPGDALELPYTSTCPPWSNDELFETAIASLPPVHHMGSWTNIAPFLSQDQHSKIIRLFDHADPQTLVGRTVPLLALLEKLAIAPNTAHAVVSRILDAKSDELSSVVIRNLQAFLDVSIPSVRSTLEAAVSKPTWDERLAHFQTLMTATNRLESPTELVKTLRFIASRIRNEMYLNLLSFASNVLYKPVGYRRLVSPLLIEKLPLDLAPEVARIMATIQQQNFSAVTEVPGITGFVNSFANQAFLSCIHDPHHPLIQVAADLMWNQAVHSNGRDNAFAAFNLPFFGADREPNEDAEVRRRCFARDAKDNQAGTSGLELVPFGKEDDMVEACMRIYAQKYAVANTGTFEDSDHYTAKIRALFPIVGSRWTRVPRLAQFVDSQIAMLASAPLVSHPRLEEAVLDWRVTEPANLAAAAHTMFDHVIPLFFSKYLYTQPPVWYTKFSDLALQSTSSKSEASRLCADIAKDKADEFFTTSAIKDRYDAHYVRLLSLSRSAIHLPDVANHLMNERQELLLDDFLDGAHGFYGVLNLPDPNSDSPAPAPKMLPEHPERLWPRQCKLIGKCLLATAFSDKSSAYAKVQAIEQFTRLPTTTIYDLADVLANPATETRMTEAVLMFLPSLDEPMAGIQFLFSPVYLKSDLARTAVHAIKRALSHAPVADVCRLLSSAFPPEDAPKSAMLKITVFKELVRILTDYVDLPGLADVMRGLWDRKKLHRDVRVALIQSLIQVLDSKKPAVANLAWELLTDAAINQRHHESAAALALLAVQPGSSNERSYELNLAKPSFNTELVTQLSDLSQFPISRKNRDKYLEAILIPMMQSRFTSADPKLNLLLCDLRALALMYTAAPFQVQNRGDSPGNFYTVTNGYWISPTVARSLAPLFLNGVMAGIHHDDAYGASGIIKDTALSDRWRVLFLQSYIGLARCAVIDGGSDADSPWQQLLSVVEHLVAMVDNSRSTYEERTNALACLSSMALQTHSYRTDFAVSFKHSQLIEPMRSTLSREMLFWSDTAMTTAPEAAMDMVRDMMQSVLRLDLDLSHFEPVWNSVLRKLSNDDQKLLLAAALDKKVFAQAPWCIDMEISILCSSLAPSIAGYADKVAAMIERLAADKSLYEHYSASIVGMIQNVPKPVVDSAHFEQLYAFWNRHTKLTEPIVSRIKAAGLGNIGPDHHIFWLLLRDVASVNIVMTHHAPFIVDFLMPARKPGPHHGQLGDAVRWVNLVSSHTLIAQPKPTLPTIATCLLIERIIAGGLTQTNLDEFTGLSKVAFPATFHVHLPSSTRSEDAAKSMELIQQNADDRQTKDTLAKIEALFDQQAMSKDLKPIRDRTLAIRASQDARSSSALEAVPWIDHNELVDQLVGMFSSLPLILPTALRRIFGTWMDRAVLSYHQSVMAIHCNISAALTPIKDEWVPPSSLALEYVRFCLDLGVAKAGDTAAMAQKRAKLAASLAMSVFQWWTNSVFNANANHATSWPIAAHTRQEFDAAKAAWDDLVQEFMRGPNCGDIRRRIATLPPLQKPKHAMWE